MRLLLVDDHPLVFDALTLILGRLPDDISTEFLTSFGEAIDRVMRPPKVDLVLLDLGLPGHEGASALIEFRHSFPDVPVGVVSATTDTDTIQSCLLAGAIGFIPKTSKAADFRAAVQTMLAGKVFTPYGVSQPRVPDGSREVAARFGLTDRQLDVLKLMARGKSNSAIGDELGLALNTVKVHVGAVLEKLNASNRTEAVMTARRYGLPFQA